MKLKHLRYLFLVLCLVSKLTYSASEIYQFQNPQQKQNFWQLTKDLRCLVCQNQNIAESNSGLANDLRRQIHQKIINGDTNTQIINYLVQRYGDFVLYQPPLQKKTFLLWFTPLMMLLSSLCYLIYFLRKNTVQ